MFILKEHDFCMFFENKHNPVGWITNEASSLVPFLTLLGLKCPNQKTRPSSGPVSLHPSCLTYRYLLKSCVFNGRNWMINFHEMCCNWIFFCSPYSTFMFCLHMDMLTNESHPLCSTKSNQIISITASGIKLLNSCLSARLTLHMDQMF